jgi:ligand-binding SRPBCC domain-containing protein
MPVFTCSTHVPASPEELFHFHETPHNLRRIAPPGIRILEIRAEETAAPGAEFTLVVRQGPLRLRWTGRWETVRAPSLLVDVGVRCPFAFWRHSHIFEPQETGSLLTDRVEFRLPWLLGGPLGDLVCRLVIFPRIFAARHAATRSWFDSHRG